MAFKKLDKHREPGEPSQPPNFPQATPSTKRSHKILKIANEEENSHSGSHIRHHQQGTHLHRDGAPPLDDTGKTDDEEEGDGEGEWEGGSGHERGVEEEVDEENEHDEENEEHHEENQDASKKDLAVNKTADERIVAPEIDKTFQPRHTDLTSNQAPPSRKSSVEGPAKGDNTSFPVPKGLDQFTGANWKMVINETLITHCVTVTDGVIGCADKPAFKLKVQAQNVPPIPEYQPFLEQRYFTMELNTQLHRSLVDFSFRSISVNASTVIANTLGLSAAYNEETTESKSTTSTTSTTQLMVLYHLPRTKINLSAKYLAVSDDCAADISAIRNASHPRERRNRVKDFYDTYGKLFSTQVTLGGSLQTVKTSRSAKSEEVQDEFNAMKASVAAKIKSSSGGASRERSKEHKALKETAISAESLVWTMTGGDPKFFTNPPAWIPTVDDFRYWGVIDRTSNEDIIKVLSGIAGYDLVHLDLRALSDDEELAMMEDEVKRSQQSIREDLQRTLLPRVPQTKDVANIDQFIAQYA